MLSTKIELLKMVLRSKKGQGMAEYGLILALVAVAAAFAFTGLKDALVALLQSVATQMAI